jgi:xanthine dehydrogenase accessory factor
MRDILDDVERWVSEGKAVATATVLETWGSAPRPAGGKMAVNADGGISGSVSGGCVENAVVEAARRTIATGVPQRLKFGIADDTAWGVGLACGGSIEVFVERLPSELFPELRDALRQERPAAVATVVAGTSERLGKKVAVFSDGRVVGDAGPYAADAARAALAGGASRRIPSDGEELFVDVLAPSAKLVIVGGVHIAVSLVTLAKAVGYRTILVDPREAFGNAGRFPHVDRIVNAWPDRGLAETGVHAGTAIAVLTHDPKLDDPAILAALRSPAFYVGALGSQRTQEKRRKRLLEAGATEQELARLHGPIGLPLGGRSPEEIAMAIMAEIVAVRHGVNRALMTSPGPSGGSTVRS